MQKGGVPKHNHAEAFCLMIYRCDKGCCQERIWNSRDGVTPFTLRATTGEKHLMRHVHWQKDLYLPKYTAKPGERVFVDATPELTRPAAVQYVDKYWEHPEGGMNQKWRTKEEAVKFFVEQWCMDNAPWVVTISDPQSSGLFLRAGDVVPFICPECSRPIEYEEKAVEILCACGHKGTAEEFSQLLLEMMVGPQR